MSKQGAPEIKKYMVSEPMCSAMFAYRRRTFSCVDSLCAVLNHHAAPFTYFNSFMSKKILLDIFFVLLLCSWFFGRVLLSSAAKCTRAALIYVQPCWCVPLAIFPFEEVYLKKMERKREGLQRFFFGFWIYLALSCAHALFSDTHTRMFSGISYIVRQRYVVKYNNVESSTLKKKSNYFLQWWCMNWIAERRVCSNLRNKRESARAKKRKSRVPNVLEPPMTHC